MKDSAIQWTDHTFNPWIGCSHAKTEAGKPILECLLCYAKTLDDNRFSKTLGVATKEIPISHWGKGAPRHRTSADYWKQPLRWNEKPMVCDGCGKSFNYGYEVGQGCPGFCGGVLHRARVFCLSLGDWLDEEVPIEWFADLLLLIYRCGNLDWQLLTKRPQNWRERICAAVRSEECKASYNGDFLDWLDEWLGNDPPPNIWIGVSAGADQKAALDIPAKVHFLSCEPMLRALDTTHAAGFDWIIFGGESGKNARRLDVDWIEDGIAFCRLHGIAPFVKQLGARPHIADASDPHGWQGENVDWNHTGRIYLKDSHGGDMSEWPENLRVREFPQSKIENRESRMEIPA